MPLNLASVRGSSFSSCDATAVEQINFSFDSIVVFA